MLYNKTMQQISVSLFFFFFGKKKEEIDCNWLSGSIYLAVFPHRDIWELICSTSSPWNRHSRLASDHPI